MTGRIVELHGDDHREVRLLLPWYVGGRLDGADRARVEGHLAGCAECRADVDIERRLAVEVAALPVVADLGWARMRGKLDARPVGFARRRGARWTIPALSIAASLLLMALAGTLWRPAAPARYHALGAARATGVGNVVVIFRPRAREADLRAALRAGDARVVDGPTAADAWVLRVPAGERAAALGRLRGQAAVALAEPIDSGDGR
ncbi:MAG: zf-HC2 domain-containing protein [Caulobacteraceae bacterium]